MATDNFLDGIEERILNLSLAALRRANTDAVYFDPGMEHRELLAPLSAGHAGELLFKALIANTHPLLLFKNLADFGTSNDLDLALLLEKGQTHEFSKLPNLLKAATGIQIPDWPSFEKLRKTRNQVQHFLDPGTGLADISLEFIYKNIDPLLCQFYGRHACQFHEDEYDDYVIGHLFRNEIYFSVPEGLELSEIDPFEYLCNVKPEYREWALRKLNIK